MQPEMERILKSFAFQRELLKSERQRTIWTLVVLLVSFAIISGRALFFPESTAISVFYLAVKILGGAVIYEAMRLLYLQGYQRRQKPLPEWAWYVNITIESLFPTFVLWACTRHPNFGPYIPFTFAVNMFYPLVILLSTLRLRPSLSLLSGFIGAGSHALLVAWTFRHFPLTEMIKIPFQDEPVLYTYSLLILLCGCAAAGIALQIQRHVVRALLEAQERQRLQIATRNTLIFGLAKLAEYRDTDTGEHLERIAVYSGILGQALRDQFAFIDEDWIENLQVASSMHDIGKVGIPDGVLLKPGLLTEEERVTIQKHPKIGDETLQAILDRHGKDDLLKMSSDITRGHHERWDGKGYPKGLAKEDIPLSARIISVADVYDALTSKRVYKPALSHEEAVKIICGASGTQFDPTVVKAFEEKLSEFDAIRRKFFGDQ